MWYIHTSFIYWYMYVFCCPVESSTIIVVLFPFLFAVIFLLCMYILCYVVHKISLKHLIFLCWSPLSNVLYISIHLFCLKLKLKFEWILYRKIFRDIFNAVCVAWHHFWVSHLFPTPQISPQERIKTILLFDIL